MNLIDQHARSHELPNPTGNADVGSGLTGRDIIWLFADVAGRAVF
jgi:hypothetical protein